MERTVVVVVVMVLSRRRAFHAFHHPSRPFHHRGPTNRGSLGKGLKLDRKNTSPSRLASLCSLETRLRKHGAATLASSWVSIS
ncbi:hypothetical protein E2C01_017604 [Portunus trituberculatus]|uniref:Uncharacterized protein n=1 Tax=Portunus trituberculatus TaxID=210409 RepID=A0A5B7DS81_PORTR|nr:hypothetical protein [Portunus trituberculatus]